MFSVVLMHTNMAYTDAYVKQPTLCLTGLWKMRIARLSEVRFRALLCDCLLNQSLMFVLKLNFLSSSSLRIRLKMATPSR